jgi:hypothetical protein
MTPTLEAIRDNRWHVVLLEPGTKRPKAGERWRTTTDLDEITHHLARSGGIGLDVAESGVIVLDFDHPYAEACQEIGPLPPATSTSPSGGFHHYFVRPEQPMPAVIEWRGTRLGEVIRGPHQHVVMPPSPYPGNEKRGVKPGGNYHWVTDPRIPLFSLPRHWLAYLTDIPSYVSRDRRGQLPDEWDGPSAEEILNRAKMQPGAVRRARGIKFQCPQCALDGHDKHRDNAVVFVDGRWACAFAPGDPRHKRAIGAALGITFESLLREQVVEEDDETVDQDESEDSAVDEEEIDETDVTDATDYEDDNDEYPEEGDDEDE